MTPFRTALLAAAMAAFATGPALADGFPTQSWKKPAASKPAPPRPVRTKVVYVDRPVDRIVEKKVYVDRPVDRIVEKIVERRVEVPVVKVVEKIVEKPVDRPVDRIVEKKVYVDRPVDRVVEKIVRVPVERIVEKPVYVDRVVERPVYVERDCDCGPRHERRREDHRGSGAVISDETYESESSRYEESSESRSYGGGAYYSGYQGFSSRYGPGGGWLPQPVETTPYDDQPYIGGGYVGRPSGGRGGGYYGGAAGATGGAWAGGSAGASARSSASASASASASSSVNIRIGGGGRSGCGGCGGGKRY